MSRRYGENVAKIETGNGLLKKSSPEALSSATRTWARSDCTGESFIETIPSIDLGFAPHVEDLVESYGCREVSVLLSLTSELQR